MTTLKLTGAKVDKAKPEPGRAQTFIWDSATPGLALRITQTGGKAYIFESRFNGKTLRMTIGDAKSWGLSDAQAEARRLQTMIDAGQDPRQVKAEKIAKAEAAKEQAKAEEIRNSLLVQSAWDEYVAKKSPRWSQHHIIDHAKVASPGGEPKKRGTGLTVQGVL